MGIALNDYIQEALQPVYQGGDITTNIQLWRDDFNLDTNDEIIAYILTQEPSYAGISLNDMLYLYFRDQFHAGFSLLLQSGDNLLLQTGDFLLLQN